MERTHIVSTSIPAHKGTSQSDNGKPASPFMRAAMNAVAHYLENKAFYGPFAFKTICAILELDQRIVAEAPDHLAAEGSVRIVAVSASLCAEFIQPSDRRPA